MRSRLNSTRKFTRQAGMRVRKRARQFPPLRTLKTPRPAGQVLGLLASSVSLCRSSAAVLAVRELALIHFLPGGARPGARGRIEGNSPC
jgi:hypothetical protein